VLPGFPDAGTANSEKRYAKGRFDNPCQAWSLVLSCSLIMSGRFPSPPTRT